MKAVCILGALLVAGCSTHANDRPELAIPKGEYRQMNPGQWAWNGNEIMVPPPGAAAATGLSRGSGL